MALIVSPRPFWLINLLFQLIVFAISPSVVKMNILVFNFMKVLLANARFVEVNLVTRKPDYAYAKTKAQISCAVCAKTKAQISCAVTAQLISAFVFATGIEQFLFFKLLAIFFSCTGRFVWDLVGTPEDRFTRVAAQMPKEGMSFETLENSLRTCLCFVGNYLKTRDERQ